MKDWLGIKLMEWRNKTVLPYLTGDVLDVGCGTNSLIKAYRACRKSTNSIGVDIYPWKGVDIIIDNAANLPFDTGSFDTVTCVAAFNHIPNRRDFLTEARRVLRKNGQLVMTMIPPLVSRIWHFLRSPWDCDQHERGMVNGEVFGFTRKQMEVELSTTDFCVVQTEYFMCGINCVYVAFIK